MYVVAVCMDSGPIRSNFCRLGSVKMNFRIWSRTLCPWQATDMFSVCLNTNDVDFSSFFSEEGKAGASFVPVKKHQKKLRTTVLVGSTSASVRQFDVSMETGGAVEYP